MIVRIRLGSSLARFAPAPLLELELPDGATVDDLYDRLATPLPSSAPRWPRRCPSSAASTSSASRTLSPGEEVALLTPVAGG